MLMPVEEVLIEPLHEEAVLLSGRVDVHRVAVDQLGEQGLLLAVKEAGELLEHLASLLNFVP